VQKSIEALPSYSTLQDVFLHFSQGVNHIKCIFIIYVEFTPILNSLTSVESYLQNGVKCQSRQLIEHYGSVRLKLDIRLHAFSIGVCGREMVTNFLFLTPTLEEKELVSFKCRPPYSWVDTPRHSCNRRLGAPQSRSPRLGKATNLFPIGCATAQAVSRRTFYHGGPVSIPGRSMWDLWWTKWYWDRYFFSSTSVCPCQFFFHWCSIKMDNRKN
jgi:hypothetical protein